MTGLGARDYVPGGCREIHDDVYARALYISKGLEKILTDTLGQLHDRGIV